jgi:carbon monoxide dehydrogenase subunit G
MKITNEFTVHTPIERAWAVLTDLEGIAPCLPGAQLTGVEGDTYSGKVKVKVGPVVSDFAGTARFIEKDDESRRAVIDAKGRDSRSAGNAAAVVTAQLRADGDRTLVNVDTDLKISGKLAQFGSGMIKEVSGKLLGQFVTNLEAKLAAEPTGAGTPSATASAAAAPTAAAASAAGRSAPDVDPASGAPTKPGHGDTSANGSTAGDTSANGSTAGDTSVDGSAAGDKQAATTGPTGTDPAATDSEDAGPPGAGTVTAGDPGTALTPSETPATAFDVAASASSVQGSALRVVPGQESSSPSGEAAGGERASGRVPDQAADEPEALDLLALAGGSVYKRLIPVGIGVAVVAAVIVWFVARR